MACASRATPTCAASSCTRSSWGTRCARTTRKRSASRSCADRLNSVSPMLNNVGYGMAVEKLMGITDKIPERAQYIRVIVGEMSRITDHMTCLGASAMELGAFTPFLYMLKAREWLFELIEEVCGARLTVSYLRIGGCAWDLPVGVADKLPNILDPTKG